MGIDLKLLIVDGRISENEFFSHTVFTVNRDSQLFDEIDSKTFNLPLVKLNSYFSKNGYGHIEKDFYGVTIKFIKAIDLYNIFIMYHFKFAPIDKGITHYLFNIPTDTLIGLYWC